MLAQWLYSCLVDGLPPKGDEGASHTKHGNDEGSRNPSCFMVLTNEGTHVSWF